MTKIFKKIFKLFIDIIVFIAFAILVIIIYSKIKMIATHSNYFDVFGYSFFNVATGSMEPTIKQNDLIIVSSKESYTVGDIITFEMDDSYITHRVINISNNKILTKGDANNTNDKEIKSDVVIGKVIKIIPNGGIWQQIFTTPSIIAMIFVTLLLFDFAFSYKGIKKNQNKKLAKKVDNIVLEQVQTSEDLKMSKKEIDNLYKKIEAIKNDEDIILESKEKDFLNYTIRLDLSELQKNIDDKMHEEENEK